MAGAARSVDAAAGGVVMLVMVGRLEGDALRSVLEDD